MANQITLSDTLLAYVRKVSLRDDEVLSRLRAQTAELPGGGVLPVQAEEGQFLEFLVRLTGARQVLEIGTYTGYSTLCLARGLAPGGRVVTCDVMPKWPEVGERYWEEAGVADRIDVRIGDARTVLTGLLDEAGAGPESFDMVFIDADKAGYPAYYEAALPLVRRGGLIVVDNTLFFGRVADEAVQDPDTVAVRELNAALRDDDRVDLAMLTTADGVTLLRKR
ncbi:class I SAM-dependent methyltransferase [Streptomyces sp. NPDC044780]|uniref:FkbG n=2 Tax=Streptomyces TaxID=1883 RepID=Q9KIE7_STRHY|nr:class I SAM-dependent methyltransferase [Streptomyces sp. SCA4-21]AAF86386.1 FkbG [Streptomyces hygroscopicus subsp. ascomyceticus]WNF00995.1 class I SAM-dependent methyltransferase [Streptomyces sp. SCA4-21]